MATLDFAATVPRQPATICRARYAFAINPINFVHSLAHTCGMQRPVRRVRVRAQ